MPRWRHSSVSNLGVFELVVDEVELGGAGEVADREHAAQRLLEPRDIADRRIGAQELLVAFALNLDQVRHLHDFVDVAEHLADALLRTGDHVGWDGLAGHVGSVLAVKFRRGDASQHPRQPGADSGRATQKSAVPGCRGRTAALLLSRPSSPIRRGPLRKADRVPEAGRAAGHASTQTSGKPFMSDGPI